MTTDETKKKEKSFQSAYNNLMVTKGNKYNAEEAKFYLKSIHESTSFSYQKILADAILMMVRNTKGYSHLEEEWKKQNK